MQQTVVRSCLERATSCVSSSQVSPLRRAARWPRGYATGPGARRRCADSAASAVQRQWNGSGGGD
eukprot:6553126-Lingulodinium_polyedra.AAC.1